MIKSTSPNENTACTLAIGSCPFDSSLISFLEKYFYLTIVNATVMYSYFYSYLQKADNKKVEGEQ